MRKLLAVLAVVSIAALACSRDDGASVRTVGGSGAIGSGSGSGSGSGTGVDPAPTGASGSLGAYTPVSEVASHAAVTKDVCDIARLLESGSPDYAGATKIYSEGKNASRSDGTKRTLKAFAATPLQEPTWRTYAKHFDSDTWLDGFVSSALGGSAKFASATDVVRQQSIQKGLQNQVLVAWVMHELDAATANVAAAKTGAADGAPHNIDEAWAFYHGAAPECSPFATAAKRGTDFGTGDAVNIKIAAAMTKAQQASAKGSAADLAAATRGIRTLLTIPYVQASIKYAAQAGSSSDQSAVKKAQAEGWAFFRVIEPLVAAADPAAAAAVLKQLDISAAPESDAGAKVKKALESTYSKLGLTAADVGTFKG